MTMLGRRRANIANSDAGGGGGGGDLVLGTRLFTANMETGDLSQFTKFSDNGGASSRISQGGEPVLQGNWSMAQTSPGAGNGTRARIDNNILPGFSNHENLPDECIFVANHYYPQHVDMGNDDTQNIFQAKQTYIKDGGGQGRSNTWSIRPWERNGSEYGFTLKTRVNQTNGSWAVGNNIEPFQYDGPLNVVAGEWFQIAMHILHSTTGNGFWKFYINGSLAAEALNAYTEVPANTYENRDFDIPADWWKRQFAVNNYPSANHTPQQYTIFVDDVGIYLPPGS